ncbi:hypothetical protein ACFLZH_04340 [Patescibacteria group bacterium]
MINKIHIKSGLTLILAVAVLLSGLYFGTLFAATTNPYDKSELTLQEVEKLYHKRVNDLFNSKLKLLKQGDEGSGTAEIPKGDECSENNYSTYCMAIAVADEYEKYAEALKSRRQYITPGEETDITKLGMQAISQGKEIENELTRSKQALDMALATYNEILPAYRMHLKYEKLIKALTKYNKKLSEFRKEVEKLPPKFIDVTTAKCT